MLKYVCSELELLLYANEYKYLILSMALMRIEAMRLVYSDDGQQNYVGHVTGD